MGPEALPDHAAICAGVRRALAPVVGRHLDEGDEAVPLQDVPDIRYDSVTVLECVAAIEDAFGVTIDLITDDLMQTFRSVATIAALVERKLADRNALRRGVAGGETT